MRNKFDQQLELLHTELIEMGSLCEKVIEETYDVLTREDAQTAKDIIANDKYIDLKERDIESLCLKLLLQQQPVAGDLRKISAALKMITDMERIGDQASDIAEIVQTEKVGGFQKMDQMKKIGEMAKASRKMVTDSIDAYVKQDLKIAREVIEYDDVVDGLFDEVRDGLIQKVAAGPENPAQIIDLLMMAKYFERIADHATNIAEWVEFSITGKHEDM